MRSIESFPFTEDRELPVFTLREIDLPDILKWGVNGNYYLLMKVEMIGLRNMRETGSPTDARKIEADFRMITVKTADEAGLNSGELESQEFYDKVTQVKSGKLK